MPGSFRTRIDTVVGVAEQTLRSHLAREQRSQWLTAQSNTQQMRLMHTPISGFLQCEFGLTPWDA